MRVYADNAASMKIRESAYNAMLPFLRENFANPSSIHEDGLMAYQAVENARKSIAECIGANPNEIYFTSGATESNNLAIQTAIGIGKRTGNQHIISTVIEHHSILEPLKYAQSFGFQIKNVFPDEEGIVSAAKIKSAIDGQTSFVSVMYANNEIGTIQPIREIGAVCRERGIIFHTDATQAVGHIPVNVEKDNIDMMSLSAHKFGGAKGVGVLYVKNGINVSPLIRGGGQERAVRSGTLNVAGIVSMATALKEAYLHMELEQMYDVDLRERMLEGLLEIQNLHLNCDTEKCLPHIINIRFDGVEGEALVTMLSQRGIMVSAGSACSSGSVSASHVLRAVGLSVEQVNSSIRISISHENTLGEINYMISQIKLCVGSLRELSR